MFAAKDTLLTRPSGGYQISRSLRFNSADTSNLSRTPSSAANQQIWTFSIWLKRSRIGADYEGIFSSGNGTDQIRFENNDVFRFGLNGSTSADFLTTQVFRDVSAWYHIVIAVDTTQATSTNRVKIYVNGSQVTSFSTATYPSQNYNTTFNNTADHRIGSATTSSLYFNGYMTEFNWIGGQQLTPSSFGETNAQTGVWSPKAYSGSYGTNGFYLNFSDNSNTTAATLGKDYSGNGNNWTPNNFSVTAGVGNDSLVDVPTSFGTDTGVGGTVRGNYATLNPLDKGSNVTLANGNLDWSGTLAGLVRGTIAAKADKYYFECVASTSYFLGFALTSATASLSANPAAGAPSGYWGWAIDDNSNNFYFYNDGTNPFTASRVTSAGDIYQLAVDASNSSSVKLWVGVNNTWYNSTGGTTGDPATGANPTVTITTGVDLFPSGCNTNSTNAVSMNFGQRPFSYTAPSGFKALCTQNLPTPTIGATTATTTNKFFDVNTWTGNGTSQTITNSGGFQPDWVWTKTRNAASSHRLTDSVRGVTQVLYSDGNYVEGTEAQGLLSFNTNGFTAGSGSSNQNGTTYVGWQWKANGSGSSNTAGSITSTVSASTTSGFSVVTYTGTGANATVGHGLGVAPSMVIVKRRSATSDWPVYHTSIGATKGLYLNNTFDASTSSTLWNNTAPTSTVFTVGTDSSNTGVTHVAYCFAPILGYSSIGSYTGNGSADGPFVFTGMRPAFVIIKAISGTGTGNWVIQDDMRSPSNVSNKTLYANLSNAEDTSYSIDFLSNGFKLRSASFDATNQSGANYAYIAFAENPFKYSLAR